MVEQKLKKDGEELRFDEMMKSSWEIGEDNRFKVKLHWKLDPAMLHNNLGKQLIAKERLIVQLTKDRNIMKLFEEQIEK